MQRLGSDFILLMKHLFDHASESFYEFRYHARKSCRFHSFWQPRVLILLGFAYLFVRLIIDPSYSGFLDRINFVIHEFGHIFAAPFGQAIHMIGGTFLQCAIPFLLAVGFVCEQNYFEACMLMCWLGVNFYDIAVYMADARAQILPLANFGGGGPIIHDWNYFLTKLSLLEWDTKLAFLVRCAGFMTIAGSLFAGAWLLREMYRANLNKTF